MLDMEAVESYDQRTGSAMYSNMISQKRLLYTQRTHSLEFPQWHLLTTRPTRSSLNFSYRSRIGNKQFDIPYDPYGTNVPPNLSLLNQP